MLSEAASSIEIHSPGEEARLISEHRSTGEWKYYLSNLSADATLKRLAGTVKARCACEQARQQLKEELGLDSTQPKRAPAALTTPSAASNAPGLSRPSVTSPCHEIPNLPK